MSNQQNPLHSVPEFKQLIDMHAYHSFMAEAYRSRGQPVPMEHTHGIRDTEQLAQTYLPPELLPQAQSMSRARQTQIGQEHQLQSRAQSIATQLRNFKASTKNIAGRTDGLTPDQAKQIRDGATTLKVENEGAPRKWSQKDVDAYFAKKYDGMSEGNLEWYANHRDTERYHAIVKKNKRDPAQLARMLDAFEAERDQIATMKHLSRRSLEREQGARGDLDYEPPAEIEVPITESDRRRLAIADALDEKGANVEQDDPTGWISDGTRENAAENTVNLQQHEAYQAAQQGRAASEVSDRRDDIIGAIDKLSTQPAEA